MGGGGGFNLFALKVTALVTLDLFLLYDYCKLFLVIKHGCFNGLGESVMQQQDGLPVL